MWGWNLCQPCYQNGEFDPPYSEFDDEPAEYDEEDPIERAAAAAEDRLSARYGE